MQLLLGNCLEVMATLPECSVDTIITDPPYGLEFMGKEWDAPWKSDRRQVFDGSLADDKSSPFKRQKVRYGVGGSYGGRVEQMHAFQKYMAEIWKAALRVAKPGAMLLSFGGTRTFHRLTCAIEDAGWEIRDCIMWLYGSGFPKSHDISKAIDKKAGAQREVVGKGKGRTGSKAQPNGGSTFSDDNYQWPGDYDITAPATNDARLWDGWGTALKPAWEPIIVAMKPTDGTFVNNALKHGVAGFNIDGSRIPSEGGRFPANVILDEEAGTLLGGKSRFFYCAKASKKDRGEGNNHPTVKPTALMEYLCRLTSTPTGGVVLDPFMGSGTTGLACKATGREFIGIELNEDYYHIAKTRLA